MNNNFKNNFVAILAIVSSTALGSVTCLGMQNSAGAQSAVGTGIVRPVERSHSGAIGERYRPNELPPIVSPSQAAAQLPRIVTPEQAKQEQTLASQKRTQERYVPKHQSRQAAMLAPIQASKPKAKTAAIDPTMAPPAIIQASNAAADIGDNSKVTQAAQWGPGGYVQTATSSAGVPLYANPGPAQAHAHAHAHAPVAPPIVNNQQVGAPPIIGPSSTRVSPAPNITQPTFVASLPTTVDPTFAPAPTHPSQGSGSSTGFIPQGSGSSTGLIPQGSGSTNVLPPSQGSGSTSFPQQTQATTFSPQYFAGPPQEGPVISGPVSSTPVTSAVQPCVECSGGGCSDCGIASAAGGVVTSNCQACGNNGCYNASQVLARAGISGSVPAARRYLLADGLLFTRTDGDQIFNSNFGSLDGFDFSGGLRLTFGAKSDSLRGREITYEGIAPVEEFETRTSAGGLIATAINSSGGLPVAATTAFQNVTTQTESQTAEFHSLEFNSVTYGWDVIKSYAGFRFLYLADDYQTQTTNIFGETGDFQLQTFNNLFGVHIGGELFYDIGRRLSYSVASKAGVFVNFSQVDTQLTSNGIDFIDTDDDNATFSTSLEFTALAHYQLSQTARFRLGYNVLFVGEVATAQDNFNPNLTAISAQQGSDGDDVVFHGLNVGFEIFR